MRNKRRKDEEWLSLIQQCRSSGFSDRVWYSYFLVQCRTHFFCYLKIEKEHFHTLIG